MRDALLIGIDGGATEVRAHAVECADWHGPSGFSLRPEAAARVYPRRPDFRPLPVAEQLAQRDAGRIERSGPEREQARAWVAAAADAAGEVARKCGAARVLVGIGMPGLKTPDGRGIQVINNGPRIPDYLAELEALLAAGGLTLAAPIAALGSDADYCGLGEEYAADGLFRDVASAYYVGCGTGIADALKLRGRLVPLDAAKSWIQKSWQMPSALGPTFERLVSASSLNRVWLALRGPQPRPEPHPPAGAAAGAPGPDFPEQAAVAGDPRAAAWLATAALVLAELIFERLWTVCHGRADAPHRGETYAGLEVAHPYRGTVLERVIIGQRLGLIYADPQYRAVFAEPLERHLAAFCAACGDAELARAWAVDRDAEPGDAHGVRGPRGRGGPPGPALRPGFLRPSRLRAAPALGAAVAAVRALAGR